MQLQSRRVSEGRLAELLSDAAASPIDLDITYRHIGLPRTAPPSTLRSRRRAQGRHRRLRRRRDPGVPQIRAATIPPRASTASRSAFTDWTAVDSLAMARFETYVLSFDGDATSPTAALRRRPRHLPRRH